MPRARIDQHFSRDNEFRRALMGGPEAKRIVRKINREVCTNGSISSSELSALLNVPRRSLHEHRIAPSSERSESSTTIFNREQAHALLTCYLPRALGWKRIQECADEHNLHRNHVEKIIRDRGEEGDLLIAEDKRLYLSPRAEKIVQRTIIELEKCADHISPKQLADRCSVGLNLVTSYFSARRVKIARDPLGRARLTPEQIREFEEWRIKVALREELPDKKIDGIAHRALKRAAAERAELLAPREDERHEVVLRRCENALRHLCSQADLLEYTELGPYLPCHLSENYRTRISVPDAARIVGASTTTIKAWRSKNPELLPAPLPGRYALDVGLFALIECAAQKYLEEPKFRRRGYVPGQIVYFQIRALAEQLHLDWCGLMECVFPSEQTRARILQRSSKLSLSAFEDLQELLADYRYNARKGRAGGRYAPQHYSNLAHALDIDAMVVPAERMTELLNACEARKGHSATHLYELVRDLCRKRGLYPRDLASLYRCRQLNTRISPFPLLAAVFLETAINSQGLCYHGMNLPRRVSTGDLVIDPLERDFGVVGGISRRFGETVAEISMWRSKKQIELTPASRLY